MVKIEVDSIVRIGFPGVAGARGRVVEDLGDGTFAVAYHDGTADVYSEGWLEVVPSAARGPEALDELWPGGRA